MGAPGMEKLTKKDADTFRAFLTIVRKGKFEVQGEAMVQLGGMFQWAAGMEKKIEATVFELEAMKKAQAGTDKDAV